MEVHRAVAKAHLAFAVLPSEGVFKPASVAAITRPERFGELLEVYCLWSVNATGSIAGRGNDDNTAAPGCQSKK
jgi:hypothetical protein